MYRSRSPLSREAGTHPVSEHPNRANADGMSFVFQNLSNGSGYARYRLHREERTRDYARRRDRLIDWKAITRPASANTAPIG